MLYFILEMRHKKIILKKIKSKPSSLILVLFVVVVVFVVFLFLRLLKSPFLKSHEGRMADHLYTCANWSPTAGMNCSALGKAKAEAKEVNADEKNIEG